MTPMFRTAQDPISSETHAAGAALSLLGGFILIAHALLQQASARDLAGAFVFVLSLIALYTASSVYHYYPGDVTSGGVKRLLRKLDHSMIYVLIAGTYTPFALKFLPEQKGLIFCAILWGIALVGTIIKLFWITAPRVLASAAYLAMGWSIVFVLRDFASCGPACLALVAGGGVLYSIGAVLYAIKKPNFSAGFGFHEVFHLFILGGSLLHYFAVFFFVV